MSDAVLIAGPTASGKSSLALSLAQRLDGEIVNADAMQVYRDLRVLTARPTTEEESRVPHHLYGVADGTERWSAGRFAREAGPLVDEIHARGKIAIVVGGTGLWMKALAEGLSPIPDIPPAVLVETKAHLEERGLEDLRHNLLSVDPAMAWLAPGDTQRHMRAWSVWKATGRTLSSWQDEPPVRVSGVSCRCLAIVPPRDDLYARCDARFLTMLERGAVDEARQLVARALPPDLPVMKAVGVPELAAYLAHDLSLDDATALAQQATRRLAKRQMTWLRGQSSDWPAYAHKDDILQLFPA